MRESDPGNLGQVFGWRSASDGATEIVLPYAPKPFALTVAIPVFLLAAAFMWYIAETNDRGASIEGIIHLSPLGATRFFYGLSILSAASALFVAIWVTPQFFIRRCVAMTDQSITIPASGWSPAHYTVEAAEIAGMKISKYGRCIYLRIYARDRRRFTINSHWLPEPEDIATIVNWVMERTGIAMDQSRGKWRYPD